MAVLRNEPEAGLIRLLKPVRECTRSPDSPLIGNRALTLSQPESDGK